MPTTLNRDSPNLLEPLGNGLGSGPEEDLALGLRPWCGHPEGSVRHGECTNKYSIKRLLWGIVHRPPPHVTAELEGPDHVAKEVKPTLPDLDENDPKIRTDDRDRNSGESSATPQIDDSRPLWKGHGRSQGVVDVGLERLHRRGADEIHPPPPLADLLEVP